jgi:hypothetical protein
MAENVVKIEIQADDSSATSAFSRLNSEVSNLGGAGMGKAQSAMSEWRKETGLSEQATMGASREMANLSTRVGKTAADFRPATAEMRAASVATKEVGEAASSSGGFMESFAGRLVGVGAAFEVLRLGAEAIKYVITESMDLESTEVRFKSLAGNTQEAATAFEGLKQAADDTQTPVAELGKASITLSEAGVKMKDIPETITQMGKAAKFTNEDLEATANALLRTSRGEVGPRDIATATRLAGDETGRLQDMYKDISITIPNIAKGMEQTQRATERTRQDADRLATRATQAANLAVTRGQHDRDLKLSAETSFGEAHGGADIFKAFQTGGTVSSLEGMHGGGQAAIQAVMTQLREGVAQIGKEQGVDAMQLVREGVIGNDEVLAAGGRSREARETASARGREDTDLSAAYGREDAGTAESRKNQDERTALEFRKEKERLQLVREVRLELMGDPDSEISKIDTQRKYGAWQATAEGQLDKAKYGVQKDASHVGSDYQYGADIDANAAGFETFPWSPKTGATDDSKWLNNLNQMAPGKAQQLGMSEESAKLLIKNTAETNGKMQALLEVFNKGGA